MEQKAHHRTDIDGLRAVAVVPVIMFHYMMLNYAPGGFVGVDIFFVISGYLITKIIYDGIVVDKFSIVDFYNRRIRRIFPALFVVYFCVCIASIFLFFPNEAKEARNGVISSAFFLSNIYFHNLSNYFDDKLKLNPLLHTWSLSVEEQFYIAFPILVYFLKRFENKTRLLILIGATVLSFAAAVWKVHDAASDAFYLMPYRAWELLLGSLLALKAFPSLTHRYVAEGLGALGLALIAGSVLLLHETSPFPGEGALAPCLGAFLVIYSGTNFRTLTSRALSIWPMQFIGLISYSLYLWHWPVIVFFRTFKEPHGVVQKIMLIALCVLLASISWWFVERPFRRQPYRVGPRKTLAVGGAFMAAISVCALISVPANSGILQLPAGAQSALAYLDYKPQGASREGQCFVVDTKEKYDSDNCLKILPEKKNVLIMGDSHAAHWWAGLAKNYPDVNFLQATASGCKPVLDTSGTPWCTTLVNRIIQQFLPQHHLDGIILSARWTKDEAATALQTAKALQRFADHVIVFGPIVEYDQSLPRLLALADIAKNPDLPAQHRPADPMYISQTFGDTFKASGISFVSIYQAVCPDKCRYWASASVPLQYDYGHLTEDGSTEIVKSIAPQLGLALGLDN